MAENGTPSGWNNFGSSNYMLALDSTNIKSGKYSATIEFKKGSSDFKAWAVTIPDNYPDGKETQRIGIVPDIELKPTIQGIKEGRDELMGKAIGIQWAIEKQLITQVWCQAG